MIIYVYCFEFNTTGHSGQKCEFAPVTTPATTPAPLRCSDCVETGTQYCTANNGIYSCVCKTGKPHLSVSEYQIMIINDITRRKKFELYQIQVTLELSVKLHL